MYYKDLSLYAYKLSTPIESIFNVGWLDKAEKFPKGEVPPDFLNKLKAVIAGTPSFDANFNRIRGVHPCALCGERNIEIEEGEQSEVLGMSEILIPEEGQGGYFASPSMVYHYVSEHGYLPPESFIKAVLSIDLVQKYIADDIFDELLCNRP